ncbi:MAG: tetratricopeptide repeat protein, partial [Deltaproteobacteria bacterium]|nr:tetratricopeptide repeat protein [Deltaproteobacteria bacterium]
MNARLHCIIVLLIACLLAPLTAQAQTGGSAEEVFFEANRAYNSGAFQEAVDGYCRLIEGGCASGHLYYNLGNAWFHLGHLGKAILAFERARLLIPRDSDLAFNLTQARDQTRDDIGATAAVSFLDILGVEQVNRYETFAVFALINILFFAVLCLRIFRKAEWTYYLTIFLAIFVGIGGCLCAVKWYESLTDDRAVVISEEVEVLAGPHPEDTVLFKIHEGTVV